METVGAVITLTPQLNSVECTLLANKGRFSPFGDIQNTFLWAAFGVSGTRQVARTPSLIPSLYLSPESSWALCIHGMDFYHSPFFVSDGGDSAAPHGHRSPVYGGQGTPGTLVTGHHPHRVLPSPSRLVLPYPLSAHVELSLAF